MRRARFGITPTRVLLAVVCTPSVRLHNLRRNSRGLTAPVVARR
jgi:hypothetical protein